MSRQVIGVGASANDGTGDTIRTALGKCNANFAELYDDRPDLLFVQTADVTVSNTVTETSILGTGAGVKSLAAAFLTAGRTLVVRVGGVYSTPALSTPSVTIKVKVGGVVVATVTTTALIASASGLWWDVEVTITCRTTGATGTVMVHGAVEYATGVAGTVAKDALNNGGATTTIDTTGTNAIDVTWAWDSATSTRIGKSTVATIEAKN